MIFCIQYECDDGVEKDVIDCIKYYAGGIANLREADYYLLFKNTYLISTFFSYPDVETAAREIYDRLYAILKDGKGRFFIIHIPEIQEEMDKVIPNALLSVNAIEWLNKHKATKEEQEFIETITRPDNSDKQ